MKKTKRGETAATAEEAVDEELIKAPKTQKKIEGEQPKMTIFEYEEKYVKRQNTRAAAVFLRVLIALIGLFFIWCLFSISKSVWEMCDKNQYVGYGAAAVSAILFIVLYIVPVVKIMKTDYFVTNVNYKTAAAAKRKNKKLRYKISARIVDLCNTVSGVGWYDGATVSKLETALKERNDKAIKEQLSALFSGSVKKSAKEVIFKCAMKSAIYSALSQENKVDSALVAVVNLQMIKDIVFLYGFRPSDSRLAKIFAAVVRNSLVAYGLGGLKIGNGIARTVGDAAKGIPFLGTVISTLVDSSVQGLTNGTLTAVIGYQTIKYLNKEYKLQNILDGVQIDETEEELTEACEAIEKELRKNKKGVQPL